MGQLKLAVFIDAENTKLNEGAFKEAISEISNFGQIIYCKIYNFSDRKHKSLMNIIKNKGYLTDASLGGKRSKRPQFNLNIAVDAIKLSCRNNAVDGYVFFVGECSYTEIASSLKRDGKYVIEVCYSGAKALNSVFDKRIYVSNHLLMGATKNKINAKTGVIAVKKAKTNGKKEAVSAEELKRRNTELEHLSVKYKEMEDIANTYKEAFEDSQELYNERLKKEEERVKLEQEKNSILEEKAKLDEDEARLILEQESAARLNGLKMEQENLKNDNLTSKLEEFSRRMSELNFAYNEDVPEKISLIADLEEFLTEQAASGRGKNSASVEERKAFEEIEGLVTNLKDTILESIDTSKLYGEAGAANSTNKNFSNESFDEYEF